MRTGTGEPAGTTGSPTQDDPFEAGAGSILRQPKAVWATAGVLVRRDALALPHAPHSVRSGGTPTAEEPEPRHATPRHATQDDVTVVVN
ncbi:hypothetical protein ABZU45_38155 [Streptomyces avermitilis]|uniref:hypothetical protein n=1 Tax=Streptomyces avermitilis TaxID=33903 RepID=UPI0033AAC025